MRVFIYKFLRDEDIAPKIEMLASKGKKEAGKNVRVFCADGRVQQRLGLAGIRSEIFYLYFRVGAGDEPTWAKAYELSDALHCSAENDNTLTYSGINFLSLEHDVDKYALIMKFSNLCRQMVEQNCDILILVLTRNANSQFPDINSPKIKTVLVGRVHPSVMYQSYKLMYRGYALLRDSLLPTRTYFKKSEAQDYPAPTQTKDLKQQKALFVVSFATLYANPALAVCDECLKNAIIPYVATDDKALAPQCQRHRPECSVQPPPSIPLLLFVRTILPLLYRLRKHVSLFFDKSNYPDTQSDEFSVAYLYKKILLEELSALCNMAIIDIMFLERLISTISPDIICVMPDGHFLQQMASALAKEKYHIPTLACSAAFDTCNPSSYMRHLHADKIAAMGEKVKKIYIESGLKPERIVATGIAHFDHLFNRDKVQDDQALLGCGIDPSKRIIVYVTDTTDSTPVSEAEERLINTIAAVLKLEDVQLVIKVHPREDIGLYQTIAEKYHDSRIHVVKDIDLYALLSSCELLITTFSTTALEVMMIDKVVITINVSGQPFPVPYSEEGAAIGVYRYDDIEQAILKLLYDEETRTRLKSGRDRFVRNWAGEPDGKASHRIVTLMKEMIAANAG